MRTLIVVGAVFMSACGGGLNCDPNATMTYGDTGFPKNCRAIIATNINAWRAGDYPPEDILASIERNCGPNGYSWGQ